MQLKYTLAPTFHDDLLSGKHNFADDKFDVSLSKGTEPGEIIASITATMKDGSVSFDDVTVTPKADIAFRYAVIANESGTPLASIDYGEVTKLRAGDTLTVKLGTILEIK